jgi:hypothetical protein
MNCLCFRRLSGLTRLQPAVRILGRLFATLAVRPFSIDSRLNLAASKARRP